MAASPEALPAIPEIAVILAAGRGQRLYPKTKRPKPLTPVLGLSLSERVMCTLREAAGIRHFIVTVGFEAKAVQQHFTDIARRRGLSVEFAEALGWQLGNGASALAARDLVGNAPFILVMSDHLFDAAIPHALLRNPPAPGEICLAVDRNKTGVFDLEDVTRVRTINGRIAAIDKNLEPWDAGDTGVMLCTAGLFAGLSRAAEKGGHSLSDGLRELAREGKARIANVTGSRWLDVDTPQALREAERLLMRHVGGKRSDGPISRYLNRPVSRSLTRYLVRTPATPNQISLFAWVLSCIAAILFVVGGYLALAVGGAVAQLASIVDGSDGEVARLKQSQSDYGGWLDAILDRYADAFLLFGLMWHEFVATGSEYALVVGFAAIVGSYMNSYTADKYDGLMATRLGSGRYVRLGRDVRMIVISLGAVTNQPLITLIVIALVMHAEVVRRIILCRG